MVTPLSPSVPLSDCRPGESGTVTRVGGEGPIGQRLLEMGIVEGTRLRVIRVAPLGDPMEIELHTYLLSLRKAEARLVEVRK
jgi:Fe2+ transport system protein FeoA